MASENGIVAGTVVDLFCGCGGLSLGAELAGFRSLVAIDVDPTLQSAYRRNFPRTHAIQGSVADIDASAWRHFLGKTRPDAVIGGPPCQGFSRIGKRRIDDPRNSLIHHFYRHVNTLRPKFFVMENVEGLLDSENIDTLTSAIETVSGHYRILGPIIVNAAHFGAATNRRRVVVIGYDPAEVDAISLDLVQPAPPVHPATVRDAIYDLPVPIEDAKDKLNYGWASYPLLDPQEISDYARTLRRPPPSWIGWKESLDFFKEGHISGLFSTRHSEAIATRYAAVPGGKTDEISKSYRLEWSGQAPTLRAGTGSDKGAFQAVRPLHPAEGRVITVREAARLQSFPDWFVFHHTKWHSFRMIGNSVPPIVSQGLMSRLRTRMGVPIAA